MCSSTAKSLAQVQAQVNEEGRLLARAGAQVQHLGHITFKEIIAQYRRQPQSSQAVFRSAVLCQTNPGLQVQSRGDIIAYYNQVFVPLMKQYLLKQQGPGALQPVASGGAATPGQLAGASSGMASPVPGLPPLPSSLGAGGPGGLRPFASPRLQPSPRPPPLFQPPPAFAGAGTPSPGSSPAGRPPLPPGSLCNLPTADSVQVAIKQTISGFFPPLPRTNSAPSPGGGSGGGSMRPPPPPPPPQHQAAASSTSSLLGASSSPQLIGGGGGVMSGGLSQQLVRGGPRAQPAGGASPGGGGSGAATPTALQQRTSMGPPPRWNPSSSLLSVGAAPQAAGAATAFTSGPRPGGSLLSRPGVGAGGEAGGRAAEATEAVDVPAPRGGRQHIPSGIAALLRALDTANGVAEDSGGNSGAQGGAVAGGGAGRGVEVEMRGARGGGAEGWDDDEEEEDVDMLGEGVGSPVKQQRARAKGRPGGAARRAVAAAEEEDDEEGSAGQSGAGAGPRRSGEEEEGEHGSELAPPSHVSPEGSPPRHHAHHAMDVATAAGTGGGVPGTLLDRRRLQPRELPTPPHEQRQHHAPPPAPHLQHQHGPARSGHAPPPQLSTSAPGSLTVVVAGVRATGTGGAARSGGGGALTLHGPASVGPLGSPTAAAPPGGARRAAGGAAAQLPPAWDVVRGDGGGAAVAAAAQGSAVHRAPLVGAASPARGRGGGGGASLVVVLPGDGRGQGAAVVGAAAGALPEGGAAGAGGGLDATAVSPDAGSNLSSGGTSITRGLPHLAL